VALRLAIPRKKAEVAERKRRGGQAASGSRAGATGGSPDGAEDKLVGGSADETGSEGAGADGAGIDDAVEDLDPTDAEAEDLDADESADSDDEDAEDADDDSPAGTLSGGGAATATKAKPKAAKSDSKQVKSKPARKNVFVRLFSRFADFVREVVAELRKVIWPTRTELITYTTVVVAFVTIMLTLVGLLDVGFAKAVMWVFGTSTKTSK
jgi:preprotein translocase subunit SecE